MMDCRQCHTANPADAKFCMNCGAPLGVTCPSCATELPAEARFCYRCGHSMAGPQAEPQAQPQAKSQAWIEQFIPTEVLAKLESARSSGGMRGERRVVTILFSDVKGSTAMAEQLDPEEWAEIMNGAFGRLITPVYRYEGTVAKLMGDGILAFFGAPIAHEDDPQRAALAALDIIHGMGPYREQVKQRWGLDFTVRVGINTGLVVVGEFGSDLQVEYTALGDAVNLASRMEQAADPGTVQITEATYRLVAPLFEFEDLGGLEVKGKAERVHAYRVVRAKADPGRLRGIEGLDSPLVGRDREMSTLMGAIAELRQGGCGRILSVMGEAGLGKSRLVAELRLALIAEGLLPPASAGPNGGTSGMPQTTLSWYEGRCLSYQSSTPYGPFVSLFNGIFGLRVEEADEAKYQKISARIAGLLPRREAEIAPLIAMMLGVELRGEARERVKYLQPPQVRDRVFRATLDLVERMAEAQPLVLVFEDLHWVDPTSLDLIEQMMSATENVGLMLIGVFRPWRQEPSWHFHQTATTEHLHRYTSVLLEPLDESGSRTLVANLLRVEDLPERVRALILAKAEGNPFFVEEVIRSLLDAGLVVRDDGHWRATREIERLNVPDTLAGVITARLDRIGNESNRVLQTASVIGREFQLDALQEFHERQRLLDALTDLQRRELVREKSRVPHRLFTFKHGLIQETVYSSMLMSRRRELHRRLAEWLERTAPDEANEIARHFVGAREPGRAVPYLVEAGDRAARAYSTPEAIAFYTQALDILKTVDNLPLARRAYEGLGGALTFGNDVPGAIANYQTMLRIARERADLPMQVSALNKMGFVTALLQGRLKEGEELLVDAERLANQCQDLPGLAEMHMTYCYLRVPLGDFDGAQDHLSDAARIGAQLEAPEPRLFGMTHIANTYTYMTRFDEAWQAAQEARRMAEELGGRQYLAELLAHSIPFCHLRNGEIDAARSSAEEGRKVAAEIGALAPESMATYMLGQIAWMRGEYEEAIRYQQRTLEAARMAGLPYLEAVALCALGTAHLEMSDKYAGKTTELHMQAMQVLAEKPLATAFGAAAWTELGFCAMALGNVDGAAESFRKGLTTPTGARYLMRPALLVGSAFVALTRGNMDEAAGLVREARDFIDERAMQHFYPLVSFAEAQVSAARGDTARALERFTQVEEQALKMRMRPMVWQARAGASQALAALGRTGEAGAKREQARSMIEEIAAPFEDEELRALFLESALKRVP